ncbi:MAG: pentapeptide repeat-containing protein [cyanobacterium endosymbiont of Rhopalodia yunnanensis]
MKEVNLEKTNLINSTLIRANLFNVN